MQHQLPTLAWDKILRLRPGALYDEWAEAWAIAISVAEYTGPHRHLHRYLVRCEERQTAPVSKQWLRWLADDEQREYRIITEHAHQAAQEDARDAPDPDHPETEDQARLRAWRRNWEDV